MTDNQKGTPAEDPETARVRRVTEYMKTFPGIKDLDLLVLKAHVIIEHELKRYLAFRLSLSDEEYERLDERMKNLPFFHVANIALAGVGHRDLLSLVLKLNDVRTEIAHRMEPSGYESKLAEFNHAVWAGKEPGDRWLATLASLGNVWARIVQAYLDARYGEGTFEAIMP